MLQALCGISNARLVFAANSGPPNGPPGLRVSAIRQGVTGMNCKATGPVTAAVNEEAAGRLTPLAVSSTLSGNPPKLSTSAAAPDELRPLVASAKDCRETCCPFACKLQASSKAPRSPAE